MKYCLFQLLDIWKYFHAGMYKNYHPLLPRLLWAHMTPAVDEFYIYSTELFWENKIEKCVCIVLSFLGTKIAQEV